MKTIPNYAKDTKDKLYSISELARELDVSTRTFRYYEELGLIQPVTRTKGKRYYTRSDRAKLKLILRGKRFGFSLQEIKEMIELFYTDSTGRKQLERAIEYGNKKIAQIDEQITELTLLRNELTGYKEMFADKLAKLDKPANI